MEVSKLKKEILNNKKMLRKEITHQGIELENRKKIVVKFLESRLKEKEKKCRDIRNFNLECNKNNET